MLQAPEPGPDSRKADTNSPLLAALKCAYQFMQQRIISNPKDLMGILLFGTEATKFYPDDSDAKSGYSFPHCYLLTDLNIPEAEDVKALKCIVENDGAATHEAFVPSKEPVNMPHVLFCANQIFQQRAANFASRRLFIITDNDNPHANDKALRNGATTRAKDLYDLGAELELFPISSATHSFDTTLFYDDIIYRQTPSDPDAISYNLPSLIDGQDSLTAGTSDGLSLLQKLLKNVASKATPKRALFASVPLELGPGLKISVKGYLLIKRQVPARTTYIYLGSDQPQLVKGRTVLQADDDKSEVNKADIRKAYKFGGEEILFTPEEMKEIRNFGDPVIRIIGFRPVESLPFWANIKHSTFLYPSEEDYVGSTRVFSALHSKLLKSKLMALTWFIPRRNAAPVVAALLPTLPAGDEDEASRLTGVSASNTPQGLHLIPLPFADDVRQNPPLTTEKPIRAPDELVDLMRNVVQQLNLPKGEFEDLEQPTIPQLIHAIGLYDPAKYPNPSLQWHYRILQALALDEDVPTECEDKTVPKYKQINKRVANEIADWHAKLEQCHKEQAASWGGFDAGGGRGAKRGINGSGGDGKRVKSEPPGEGASEEAMRKLWQKGALATMTIPGLRAFLESKKLPLSGKKQDLVDRVESFFESR